MTPSRRRDTVTPAQQRLSLREAWAMTVMAHAAAERIGGNGERYLDADGCVKRYGFSRRHWARLVDSGRAIQPTRFGRLCRFKISALEEWEAGGCKPIRVAGKAVRA